jgi:hypothetical protein
MIKITLVFILLTVLICAGILAFQKMNGSQLFSLTKAFIYATISSSIAIMLMTIFVILF